MATPTHKRATSTSSPAAGKVVVVMGATGTGKSRLAIDLALIFDGEVINCDKIQVYTALHVISNKVTPAEARGVAHHLLGIIDDPDEDFTAAEFVFRATQSADAISGRARLPIIAGGSNSFIEALVSDCKFQSRYECCFLWVDVSKKPVHLSHVKRRVDVMVGSGLVDEAREFYGGDYARGVRRAIGVPEMDEYFWNEGSVEGEERARLLQSAVEEIKENTWWLVGRQLGKIHAMGERIGWERVHRLDATEAFERWEVGDGTDAEAVWKATVVEPSVWILSVFLGGDGESMGSGSGLGLGAI
ncbi:adenylate isopentenyltransferase [Striga asiatica]|uniref:Adenylate isopentenyltransferase n=1 Tax=Striga asiatica TaxID=4170 RepID=A0A5A7PI90_STRAF|nr:adenylate isopentenyltransferase [Striga asiatica]